MEILNAVQTGTKIPESEVKIMKKQNNENKSVYTVNGKKAMFALFEDEDYEALKNGEAVDNNGFRSPKGNYRPRQPEYADITPEAAAEIARTAASPSRMPVVSEAVYAPAVAQPSVPSVRREPSGQIGRQVGGFLFRNVVVPVGSRVWNQYALPWLADTCGDWFCKLTGYRKPVPIPVYAQPVIDAEEVRPAYDSTHAADAECRRKTVRFPA